MLLYFLNMLNISNLSKCKVSWKTKNLWDKKYLVWVFLGRTLKKTIVTFKISTLEFLNVKTNSCKTTTSKFGIKISIIWKQLP